MAPAGSVAAFAMLAVALALALPVPRAAAQDNPPASAGAAAAAPGETMLSLTIKNQDTLIGLGRRLFKSPTAWQEVARLNRLRNPNRLAPGQVIEVPERLLRWEGVQAQVISVAGSVVAVDGTQERGLTVGDRLNEGSTVRTAAASAAVLELGDGTRVKLPPETAVEISTHRRYGVPAPTSTSASTSDPKPAPTPSPTIKPTTQPTPGLAAAPTTTQPNDGWFAAAMRLISGSVEVVAAKLQPRDRPLETRTPTAVIGVRGTVYRVGLGGAAGRTFTRAEVLEGRVQADATTGGAGASVAAGFGVAVDDQGTPPVVRNLPPAPELGGVPARHERPVVRFASPAADAPLRVQVAEDAAFERIVIDELAAPGAEVRIAGLPDGDWQLRARRIDASGIEGLDGRGRFVLKARPEPPASVAPRPGAKANLGPVDLAWAENTQARHYRVQVAEDADASFARPLLDRDELQGAGTRIELPAAGLYRWRLASVARTAAGQPDPGPWGDAQGFELKALPEPPQGAAGKDGVIQLNWSGRAQDRYQVELARDEGFTQIVAQAEVPQPEWQPPQQPAGGSVYFRYRSVEPDGWISPPSSTLRIELPKPPSRDHFWLLAPLLLLL